VTDHNRSQSGYNERDPHVFGWAKTEHYLLDHHTGGKPGQWDDGPANYEKSFKLQAASVKQQAAV
tara:strand:+ start:230 stop:424 length:195 start_codon:yes stop_codon:yes gene_type:complete